MISCFKGKFKVTSVRGYRVLFGKLEYHKGLDLVGITNTDVYAIANGTIDATPYEKNGFGYYIRQILPDGRRIYYAHLKKDSIVVKNGQKVVMGQKLGTMGSTGNSTGAHTHLEIRPKGILSDSLNISEFTGIPNIVGTYDYVESNKYSYDKTVDNMIVDGVTTIDNMENWEKMLNGRSKINSDFVRTILDRYHKLVNKD